jgi:hypothetical protein
MGERECRCKQTHKITARCEGVTPQLSHFQATPRQKNAALRHARHSRARVDSQVWRNLNIASVQSCGSSCAYGARGVLSYARMVQRGVLKYVGSGLSSLTRNLQCAARGMVTSGHAVGIESTTACIVRVQCEYSASTV